MKIFRGVLGVVVMLMGVGSVRADGPVDGGQWLELFKGVEYRDYVVDKGGGQVRVHVARMEVGSVDFFVSPGDETADNEFPGLFTSSFVREYGVQLAINGSAYYSPKLEPEWAKKSSEVEVISEGVHYGGGLSDAYFVVKEGGAVGILWDWEYAQLKEKGEVVMALGGWAHSARSSILVNEGMLRVIDSDSDSRHARTGVGISEDGRWVYFFVVDGGPRVGFFFQDKVSVGVTLTEFGIIMKEMGVWIGMNLDGSGSSSMAMEGVDGVPVLLNLPSDYKEEGERAVATHIGVRAERLSSAVKEFASEEVVERVEKVRAYRDRLKRYGLADEDLFWGVTEVAFGSLDMDEFLSEISDVESSRDLAELGRSFGEDMVEEVLDRRDLIEISEKVSGASRGGVYMDEEGVVWFVKTGQNPWKAYIGSKLMNLLMGTESTPLVKLVLGEGEYVASRMTPGFEQLKELNVEDRDDLEERLRLATVMDFLGLVDRHDRNMGYVGLDGSRKVAARVDFDHIFFWKNDFYGSTSAAESVIMFEETLLDEGNWALADRVGEMLQAMDDILAVSDSVYEFTFYRALVVISMLDPSVDLQEYENILTELKLRKAALKSYRDNLMVYYKSLKAFIEDPWAVTMVDFEGVLEEQFGFEYGKFERALLAEVRRSGDVILFEKLLRGGVLSSKGIEGMLASVVIEGDLALLDAFLEVGLGSSAFREALPGVAKKSLLNNVINSFELLVERVGLKQLDKESNLVQLMLKVGNLDFAKDLVDMGFELGRVEGGGADLLRVPVRRGDWGMVRLLVEAGADPSGSSYVHPLNAAVESGDIEGVKMLIGFGLDWRAKSQLEALLSAVELRNMEMMRLMLDAGANLNYGYRYPNNPLVLAVTGGDIEMVKLFLEYDLDLSAEGNQRGLGVAGSAGSTEMVRLLLDAGADVNASRGFSSGALSAAARQGDLEIVKLLLGAGVNWRSGIHDTALGYGVQSGSIEVVRLLLEGGADVNVLGHDQESLFESAANTGKIEMVQVLLDAGANINPPERYYRSGLGIAAKRGDVEMVRLMLGADVDWSIRPNADALVYAVESDSVEMVRLLLQAGAGVNPLDKYGKSAIGVAALSGNAEMVELLLSADVDWSWSPNQSVLGYAASRENIKIVEMLLEAGADVNAYFGGMESAITKAASRGNLELVKLLLNAGADLDLRANNAALLYAAEIGNVEMARLLLEAGADVNDIYAYGKTVISEAAKRGHFDVVRLLLEYEIDWSWEANWQVLDLVVKSGDAELAQLVLEKTKGVNWDLTGVAELLNDMAEEGNAQMVKFLLDAGLSVNTQYGRFETVLSAAASAGRLEVVKLLLGYGVDLSLKVNKQAIGGAANAESPEIVKLLLEAGADVNARFPIWGGALAVAAYRQNIEIVRLLLNAGVDWSAESNQRALEIAAEGGNVEIVKLLLGAGAEVNFDWKALGLSPKVRALLEGR